MKTCCGYSLEVPQQGTSNEYPQHMFPWRNKTNINTFWLKKKCLLWNCETETKLQPDICTEVIDGVLNKAGKINWIID